MPAYVGGDLVRRWYIGKRVGQHEALTATILERYTGLVAMVGLATLFVWIVDGITFEIQVTVVLAALGLFGLTLVALSEWVVVYLGKFSRLNFIVFHIRKVQAGLRLAKSNKPLLIKTLVLSLLFHCVTVVNVMAAAYAVGWFDPPVWKLFVVLPLILLIGSIPVTPSGLGVQEGAFYYFLHAIGASPAQALGVGVVLRAKAYVLAFIGGLIWLRVRKENLGQSVGADPFQDKAVVNSSELV